MITEEIKDRLNDKLKALKPHVDFAASAAEINGKAPKLPAIFIVEGPEDAEKDSTSGGTPRQRVTVNIIIVVFVKAISADKSKSKDTLSRFKEAVKIALAGWTPASATSPIQYKNGNIGSLENAQASYIINFSVRNELKGDG